MCSVRYPRFEVHQVFNIVASNAGTWNAFIDRSHVIISNVFENLNNVISTSFLTLHILNLITPLTPSRHTSPSNAGRNGQVNIRKVDITGTAPGLRSALNALVEASTADLRGERDLFVKVSPPIHIKVVVRSTCTAFHALFFPFCRSFLLLSVSVSLSQPNLYIAYPPIHFPLF